MKERRAHIEELLAAFQKACQKHKLRITPQRTAIYLQLVQAKDHPNAEALYSKMKEQFPNITLDTVNRTLLTFAKIGLADVVEGRGEPKRFDPNLDAHHHARCVKCGKIIDFHNVNYTRIDIPEEIKVEMTVLTKRIVLEGVCKACKKSK